MTQPNLSRRSFLTGALVLTAVASVPMGPKTLQSVPTLLTLHGDGIHDSTEALQAFLNGKPVKMWNTGEVIQLTGDTVNVRIPPGTYRISDTLVLKPSDGTLDGTGARIIAAEGFRGEFLFDAPACDMTMTGFYFDLRNMAPSSALINIQSRSPWSNIGQRSVEHVPAKKMFTPLHKAWESPYAAIGRG